MNKDNQIKKNIKKWQEYDDINARNDVFNSHINYAYSIASKFNVKIGMKYQQDQLNQYALLGLLRAIDLHDTTGKAKFTSYAHIKINGAIKDNIIKYRTNKSIEKARHLKQDQEKEEGRNINYDEVKKITKNQRQIMNNYFHHQQKDNYTEGSVLDELQRREQNGQFTL